MVDFSKYKLKEKKSPDEDRVGGSGHTIHDQEKKLPKPKMTSKEVKSEVKDLGPIGLGDDIDKKLTEILNERLLKLVTLGLQHELSLENMIRYFREVKKTKLYELRRYFSDSPAIEINKMLKYLYSTNIIKKDKDNWYYLK